MKAVFKGAVVVAALVAFASPASAQGCGEGDIQFCGFVWNDINGDGIQNDDPDLSDGDQTGIDGVKVTLFVKEGANWAYVTDVTTSGGGLYTFDIPASGPYPDGEYKLVASAPTGTAASCPSTDPMCPSYGTDNTLDNDGVNDPGGAATFICLGEAAPCVPSQESDFGFTKTNTVSPGTGTPGYWKNHPEAWPMSTITIGDVVYSVDEAITYMGKVSKDKRISLFTALVAAKLNVAIGNESSCIGGRISEADAWMGLHKLVPGSLPVAAASADWQQIAPAHKDLDDYNNGRLCAPHRN